jgi:DNA invertase Pin-like site-specific DNA recombinase
MNLSAGMTTAELPQARTIIEIPATVQKKERDIRKLKLRVAAYCRVSTDSEEQLNSYKSQIEYYTAVINENPNWKLVGIFPDEGLTGTSTKKRVQFNRMIKKCKKGRIDLIIVKSISRFARNTLDSLNCVRVLKKLGIGVLFEKESVNTLEMEDETIFTIFSSLAQAESESLSKNVAMGFRQSFKAGKVPFHYNGFLGYRRGADGNPEIVREEAKTVKRIFHRYLAGDSVAQICRELEADGVRTARGGSKWSPGVIQYMIQNERYIGDALLQKTYVFDMLTHKTCKNEGVLPQYYIRNNHPGIIDREVFRKVQEEIARRGAKFKKPSKTAKTERSKYSGKYALNEILLCSECGTPYRRVTWTYRGERRVVWRCISRLEHGKKYCKESPTLNESELHAAIMEAVSDAVERNILLDALADCAPAASRADKEALSYLAAKRGIDDLDKKLDNLLRQSSEISGDEEYYDRKFKMLMDERAVRLKLISAYEETHAGDTGDAVVRAAKILETETLGLTEYDDRHVRQLVDTIRVLDAVGWRLHLKAEIKPKCR